MRATLLLFLFLTGCATMPRSNFITVSKLHCAKLSEMYSDEQLVNVPEIARRNNIECVEDLPSVRIRKSLVRTLIPLFHVETEKEDPMGDLYSPLRMARVNVEYCQLGGPKGTIDTSETCREIEEKLNE